MKVHTNSRMVKGVRPWKAIYWIGVVIMGFGFMLMLYKSPLKWWLGYVIAGMALVLLSLIQIDRRIKSAAQ